LAYACPKEPRRAGCPLKKIDHLAFFDKVAWIERLGEDEIRELISQNKDGTISEPATVCKRRGDMGENGADF
tara:strand:+ start:9753 stop:9968 length:216 start_codon:yes stop_codon:yes gene_type:complete